MKVIQVPMYEAELHELTVLAKSLKTSRSDLIRQACREYLQARKALQLDEAYRAGYAACPESADFGMAAEMMVADRIPPEDW